MAKLVSKKIIHLDSVFDISVADNHNFYANDILVHNCQTKASQQGNNLLKLDSDYKIAATGTLITNSPLSAYLPLVWTENDHSILTTFKPQYLVYGGFNNSQVIGYKNLDILHEEIEACSLRRTLNQVRDDMPAKNVQYELLELNSEHDKFYNDIKAGVKEEADKIELNSSNLLALTTRLRQASVDPSIISNKNIQSTKLIRCVELVEELISNDEKVVILSNFLDPVKNLAKMLSKYNPLICTGEVKDDVVQSNVDKFRNCPNYNVIIGTHGRMGTGLSMPEAKYLIMLDTPFTFSQFDQSCDRIYRITSKEPVTIIVLVNKNTIDERVKQIVETKRDLGDYIVDGKENHLSTSLTNELKTIIEEL